MRSSDKLFCSKFWNVYQASSAQILERVAQINVLSDKKGIMPKAHFVFEILTHWPFFTQAVQSVDPSQLS